jgi:hypothetical protein
MEMKSPKSYLGIAVLALAAIPALGVQQGPPPGGPPGPGAGPRGPGQVQRPMQNRPGFRQAQLRRQMLRRGMALGRMMRDPAFREAAGISADQAAKFEAQRSAFAKATIRNRADLQLKRLELAEILRAENPDRTQLDRKLRELEDARFAARKAAIDHQLALRALFPAEQRQKMQAIARERLRRGPGPGMTRPRPVPRPDSPDS